MMRVRKASLGQLKQLSEGGFGKVYRVDEKMYRLPGDPAPLAYKEFTSEVQEQAQAAERAVQFREQMRPRDRADLDEHAVWPRALVEDQAGVIIGLLMPLILPDFFFRGPDPDTGQMSDRPRGIEWLFTDAAYRAAAQVDIPDIDMIERLIVLGKLVYAIGRLHKLSWVFGDISGKNAVFALEPPRILLLDCDGAAPIADQGRNQGNTPTWEPPESMVSPPPGQPKQHILQTPDTDVYKLGLAIVRGLTEAMQARKPDALAGGNLLDPPGFLLVARTLDANPHLRPTAKELYTCLQGIVAARARPPEVTFARVRKPFMLRGQGAWIDWQIKNATAVTVWAAGQQHRVDLAQYPDGFPFKPVDSGPVRLTVTNRLGSLPYDLGEITLYELPSYSVNLGTLPTPWIPDLPPFSLKSLGPVLDRVPAVQLPELPPVPSLQTYDLIDTLMKGTVLSVRLPRFAEAVLDASRAVADLIWDDAVQRAEATRPVP
jgi:hypothetical protein